MRVIAIANNGELLNSFGALTGNQLVAVLLVSGSDEVDIDFIDQQIRPRLTAPISESQLETILDSLRKCLCSDWQS